MDAHSGSIRCGPKFASAVLALAAQCASVAAFADSPTEHRFALTGSGSVKLDQPDQRSGSLTLRAYLVPSDAALSSSPPVQDGGSFALMAKLLTKPTVCYNDTIFRNDFDGDGF